MNNEIFNKKEYLNILKDSDINNNNIINEDKYCKVEKIYDKNLLYNDLDIRKKIRNAEGLRLLEETKINYCKKIIRDLNDDPSILGDLLMSLEVTEDEFFDIISGNKTANITFYDEALNLTRGKKK